MEHIEATVTDADEGIRLDRWFKRHHPDMPHAMLEKQLRKGDIRVDGKKAKSSTRLELGQVLRFPQTDLKPRPKKTRPPLTFQEEKEVRSWVLFMNEHVIVLNKPHGLAVQGGTKVTRCVDDLLYGLGYDMEEPPKLCHRLDRDTSGVLVLGRTAKAAAKLSKAFASKTIEKTYWAIICGCPLQHRGTVDAPLGKAPRAADGREQAVIDHEEGKKAVTEYLILDNLAQKYAHVELYPITGRMHQLRVHMSAIGHPILGDHKYGGSDTNAESLGVENILHLHARKIIIPPMFGEKEIEVTAPLPPHMSATFKALGLDLPKETKNRG